MLNGGECDLLYTLTEEYNSVSIIGMCKNAGKTTVLNGLISACAKNAEVLGLTSIGRDGERSDLVTNTKKPEIFVHSGTIVATAENALNLGDISREILDVADMPTPMGSIVIARAMSDGFVQLAGPSMTAQISRIRDELLNFGVRRVFIDGALSRKSLAMPSVSEAAILCSGASYSPDMLKTVKDTAHAVMLMSLKRTETDFEWAKKKYAAVRDGERLEFDDIALFSDELRRNSVKSILLRGGFTDLVAAKLLTAGKKLENAEIVCEDGSRLLLSGQNAQKLLRAGARFSVLQETRLLAVTVNPFSAYGNHYDKAAFIDRMRESLPSEVKVINVLESEGREAC